MWAVKAIRDVTYKSICALLQGVFQRNEKYFYGRYFGTDHLLVLIVKNVLKPKRFIKKVLYGQIIPIPFALSGADEAKELPELSHEWEMHLETLRRDGIVFIRGFFKDSSKSISKRYKIENQEFPASSKYYRFVCDLGDKDLFNITSDAMMFVVVH